jgi:hypothetical protein
MSLSTIEEIERAIATLSPGELERLYSWLDAHHPQPKYQALSPGLRDLADKQFSLLKANPQRPSL